MPQYILRIDDRKLHAYLTVIPDSVEEAISAEMVISFLKSRHINYGIKEDVIAEYCAHRWWDEEVLVADGKPPITGKDGKVTFFFETTRRLAPRVKADDSVDFHSLDIVQNVTAGQILAEITPPTDGEAGITVYGNVIFAKRGRVETLVAGANTSFVNRENAVLQAEIAGNVKWKPGNLVVVDTIFEVVKDVDYNTGDIDTFGDIIVLGDVRSGFTLKASGNIEVKGTVEDASVLAGGDVVVRHGFSGAGRGVIEALGSVAVRFVQNQCIMAGEDIQIGEEALHAVLQAGHSVQLRRGQGKLVGGSVSAGSFIEASVIGNEQGSETEITVADTNLMERQLEVLRGELQSAADKSRGAREKLATLLNQIYHMGWMEALTHRHREAKERSEAAEQELKSVQDKISALEMEMEKLRKNGYVKALRQAHPSTRITIGGVSMNLEQSLGPTIFHIEDGEVKASPLVI
jgi:hypothetical protein